ncbi:MAG: heavy metal-binding domain-containing protein [Rudaea sp.]
MGILDWLKKSADPEVQAAKEASAKRQAEIQLALRADSVPAAVAARLEGARSGALPWIATLSPAELLITQSHGIRPIASVSATCWMQYGYSWTDGHAQGWKSALHRLRAEAKAAGANAVVDVKMRTVSLELSNTMDFSLIGTAVKVDGLPPSAEPIVATVPALEFVRLLEADVVPTGIAVGAHFEWLVDWRNRASQIWMGNVESEPLTNLWHTVRQRAQAMLHQNAGVLGNGVLAHVNFSQIFEVERNNTKEYLARQIIVATTVAAKRERPDIDMKAMSVVEKRRISTLMHYRGSPVPLNFQMVVDMHAGRTPLSGTAQHHQSYKSQQIDVAAGDDDDNDDDGAI